MRRCRTGVLDYCLLVKPTNRLVENAVGDALEAAQTLGRQVAIVNASSGVIPALSAARQICPVISSEKLECSMSI
jgi:hypothetical protein